MNPCRLALAVLLLAAPVLSLSPALQAGPALEVPGPSAVEATSQFLPVTVRCEACREEAPTLSLLWRGASATDPAILRSVVASDWSAGEFTLVSETGNAPLRGVAVENGWALQVPIADRGLPFRVVTSLQGFVADRAAWWPEQERTELSVSLRPIATVLDAHPTWDPARSGECDLLIPKSATPPIVFLEGGQPRAWLFPTPGATAGTADPAWTFQFVRPGASLLERVSVGVTAFDEGDSWSLRVPLSAVLSSTTRTLPTDAGRVDVADEQGIDQQPRAVTLAGVGSLSLLDCPRAVR